MPKSGRMLKEDGSIINIADILGGTPTGEKEDIEKYAPMSGRMLKEDGTVINIADAIENGGGGGGGVTTPNKPLTITVNGEKFVYDGKKAVDIELTIPDELEPAEGVNF